MPYHSEEGVTCRKCSYQGYPSNGECPDCGGPLEEVELFACDACGELYWDEDDADECCEELKGDA